MKVQAAMAVLAFVAVQAAAVPEAQPNIAARDAAACGSAGNACFRKRSAEPLPNARRLRGWLGKWCVVPGQACYKRRDAEELADVGNEVGFCGSPGQPCAMVKRAANAIAEAVAAPEADPRRLRGWLGKWCVVPGQACYKARDLSNTVVDHVNDVYGALYEREAEAEASAHPEAAPEADPRRLRGWIGKWCVVPGQACYRKRDVADAHSKIKRDAEADPRRLRGWLGKWCVVPGQACYRKRDAEAIIKAVKSSQGPNVFRAECYKAGGECDRLLKIQKAYAQAKIDNAQEKNIKNPQQRLAYCKGQNECTSLTHAHQYASQHGPRSAQEAEDACNAPEGLCTLARRDLEGIEQTLNSAVDALAADDAEGEVATETEGDDEE